MQCKSKVEIHNGFTLIEISIVIVVIGLLLSGILVGKSLIEAAALRSTITQIESYQVAVNTFQLKFNCLPGDCKNASQFGLPAGGTRPGERDGNGLIQGYFSFPGDEGAYGTMSFYGEGGLFFTDLSKAGLINETFNATLNQSENNIDPQYYVPRVKNLSGSHISVNSGVYPYGVNQFTISKILDLYDQFWAQAPDMDAEPSLTSAQAYYIDSKIDDGLPQHGKVTAQYLNTFYNWWAGGFYAPGGAYDPVTNGPTTEATPMTLNTCYDNNNVAGAVMRYSRNEYDESGRPNCALSFWMQ
jgi:prepilin-type N-terminal cleavage/methylation domain-containing protein